MHRPSDADHTPALHNDSPSAGTTFSWGIVGPGGIAGRFADAVANMHGTTVRAVWGRDAARAERFVQHHLPSTAAPARVYGDLASLLADPGIDAVYIATPHDSHDAFARACLMAGKPVLSEKPLTPTTAKTQAVVTLARSHQVFLMEALWTVFLPLYDTVRQWLREGRIGDLQQITSSFCFHAPYRPDSRLYAPERAGGTLLDIGVYNLAATRLVMAAIHGVCPDPLDMQATGTLAPTGVDQQVDAVLHFDCGVTSSFRCAFTQHGDNALRIVGSHGEICIEAPFWEGTKACLRPAGQPPAWAKQPFEINGFEYEICDAMRAIRAGAIESHAMPHAESLALVGWIDELRRQLGVRYPFESG